MTSSRGPRPMPRPPSCRCTAWTSTPSCANRKSELWAKTMSSPSTTSRCNWPSNPAAPVVRGCASPSGATSMACSPCGTGPAVSAAMTARAGRWRLGPKRHARIWLSSHARAAAPPDSSSPHDQADRSLVKTERTFHLSATASCSLGEISADEVRAGPEGPDFGAGDLAVEGHHAAVGAGKDPLGRHVPHRLADDGGNLAGRLHPVARHVDRAHEHVLRAEETDQRHRHA